MLKINLKVSGGKRKENQETKTEEETEVCCSQDKNYLNFVARVEGATPG